MTVYQRGRTSSANWSPVKGLENIPAECRRQARETVRELNRQAGWIKYQLV